MLGLKVYTLKVEMEVTVQAKNEVEARVTARMMFTNKDSSVNKAMDLDWYASVGRLDTTKVVKVEPYS